MESSQLTAPEGALEDAHRAAGKSPSGARPDPEVVATARRRQFTSADKRRILEAADRCTQPGEIGALLRKEGIYSSHLSTWRKQRAADERAALAPQKRGRKADPLRPRIAVCSNSPRKMTACAANWSRPMPSLMSKKNLRLARTADGRDAERVLLMQALNQLAPEVGLAPACAALNLSRSSVYREDARRRLLLPATATLAPRPPAPLAFSAISGNNCWRCSTANASPTARRILSMPPCWTRGATSARCAPVPRPGGGRPVGGAQAPTATPGLHQAGTSGHRAQQGLELGYHET